MNLNRRDSNNNNRSGGNLSSSSRTHSQVPAQEWSVVGKNSLAGLTKQQSSGNSDSGAPKKLSPGTYTILAYTPVVAGSEFFFS